MRVTPLYAESDTKFSEIVFFGTPYLVNKNNLDEREPFTSKLEGRNLYKQGDNFLFLYENKLFRIEGAKACELHFCGSTNNYLFLMVYGDDDFVYFYSAYPSKVVINSWEQINENPVVVELGKVKVTNFKYFIYFFKKSITTHDADGKPKLTMYDEEFVKDFNPFFVLKAISQCLEETSEDFRLVPFSDSKEVFLQNNNLENAVTTFIKLTRDKMYYYDIVGNDFTILQNYVWEEYDIIDDWEYYQDPYWATYYKDWILNGTQLINISEFLTYDIKPFMDKFENPKVSLWKPNEDEIYVFFSDKSEESQAFKNGILWNLKKNTVYPSNVNLDANNDCEPVLFWHWNFEGIPNVTVERIQNKNIFKIWYRGSELEEFINIESQEAPTVFYDGSGRQIYFVKSQDYDYMVVIDKTFKLISFDINVSFFEEINLYRNYPINLRRNINDEGQYLSNVGNHYVCGNAVIIVKEKMRKDIVFHAFFGDTSSLNRKYSFKSYTFLPNNNEERNIFKIQIENPSFNEPHYIVITFTDVSFGF